jgi:hypothetical protein
MGNLKGSIFFMFCAVLAVVVWGLNIVYVDNALPQVLSSLFDTFDSVTMGNFNPVWWVQFFTALERYSPLFIVFVGGVGWLLEAYIFNRGDNYYARSRYQ